MILDMYKYKETIWKLNVNNIISTKDRATIPTALLPLKGNSRTMDVNTAKLDWQHTKPLKYQYKKSNAEFPKSGEFQTFTTAQNLL